MAINTNPSRRTRNARMVRSALAPLRGTGVVVESADVRAIREHGLSHSATKEDALAYLKKAGFLDGRGRLAKQYRP